MDSDDLPPPPPPDDVPPPPLPASADDSFNATDDLSYPSPPAMSPDFPTPPVSPTETRDSAAVSHVELIRTSSNQSNTGENDDDESEDEFDFTDADAAIDKMLDDLQDFQMELGPDKYHDKRDEFLLLSPVKPEPPSLNQESFDHLRISMGNIEETPEVDLDALLEDLCSMERDIKQSSAATLNRKGYNLPLDMRASSYRPTEEDDEGIIQFTPNSPTRKMVSPVMVTHDVKERLENLQNEMESKELTPEEQEARFKTEKMKIALDKMKAASFQKLFIKVLNSESRTTKTMMIDQTWNARDITQKMIAKDDVELGPNWSIVEKLPEMYMERILEDHEYVLQTVLDWPRETENLLVFLNRRDKYILFKNPQNFLLSDLNSSEDTKLAEKSKDILLNEFFTKENTQIPHLEGVLWLREGNKKWNKHYFALRASGIYYSPKGKQKTRELSCLVKFEITNVYLGVSFKKKFKAPTDHVFCIKHPKIQTLKSKHVFCMCAEDNKTLYQWVSGIRMAKYGYNMYEDYLKTQAELESVLLAGTSTKSNGASDSNISTGFSSNSNSMISEKKTVANKMKERNAAKNVAAGESKRVKGKQNALGEIFATAWRKGSVDDLDYSEEIDVIPDTPRTPDTAFLKSPVAESTTFDFGNCSMATANGTKPSPNNAPVTAPSPNNAPVTAPPPTNGKTPSNLTSQPVNADVTLPSSPHMAPPPPPPPPPPPLPPPASSNSKSSNSSLPPPPPPLDQKPGRRNTQAS